MKVKHVGDRSGSVDGLARARRLLESMVTVEASLAIGGPANGCFGPEAAVPPIGRSLLVRQVVEMCAAPLPLCEAIILARERVPVVPWYRAIVFDCCF